MINFNIRTANLEDVPFLVQTIIEAEKSGGDVLSYKTFFGLEEQEIENLLTEIFNEEIEDCELSISSFLIAEKQGVRAAALSGWLENASDIPSIILKGNLLKYHLPITCFEKASSLSYLTKSLHIDYIPNTFQIGAGYVAEGFRGQKLLGLLTKEMIQHLKEKNKTITEIYVRIFDCNIPSLRTYEKEGFKVISTKESEFSEITDYLPSSKKLLLKKEI
jgi:hypothetical protein